MPRRNRSYLPGTAFHITARTLARERWFTPEIRDGIVAFISDVFALTDAILLAFCVMPNHFHLIVRQGIAPLSRFMQPLGRRTAVLVQHHTGRTGHIFERRFHERPCADADYLRNAIVYTHLNPVRAGLCAHPEEYAWSSHNQYAAASYEPRHGEALVNVEAALSLFRIERDASHDASTCAYAKYTRNCAEYDETESEVEREFAFQGGDAYWAQHFESAARQRRETLKKPDLRDVVRSAIRLCGSEVDLEMLRYGMRTSAAVRARRAAIESALIAGHRGASIARFLNISETTVSRITTELNRRTRGRLESRIET